MTAEKKSGLLPRIVGGAKQKAEGMVSLCQRYKLHKHQYGQNYQGEKSPFTSLVSCTSPHFHPILHDALHLVLPSLPVQHLLVHPPLLVHHLVLLDPHLVHHLGLHGALPAEPVHPRPLQPCRLPGGPRHQQSFGRQRDGEL